MRTSWDTSIKHLTRHGLLRDMLTPNQIAEIPRSNLSRWKQESNDKYQYSELNQIIEQEIHLIKRINQSSKIKKINEGYFKLVDTFHEVIRPIKGVKSIIKSQKELIVNTIESVKGYIPINTALRVFNISRSTFENYKSIVIHKCEASYFHWCTKRFPHQLLSKEVLTIKKYMNNFNYKFWSKSSIYLKAVRNNDLQCALSTFYKYCRLLGFNNRPHKRKADDYAPVKTNEPNQLWCADVTIFKTLDGTKHYIHFLMDHYSKLILGYRICKSASGIAIRDLLADANTKFSPDNLQFLTDGGSENVNHIVTGFINQKDIPIEHIIAQKDVVFSNSMVEALNKVIKHQFLHPLQINCGTALKKHLEQAVNTYNTERPQQALGGNTPLETQNGTPINFSAYTTTFGDQKTLRTQINKLNACRLCQ